MEDRAEGNFRIIDNEIYIYYGEVIKDNPEIILGKGILVTKKDGVFYEGWFFK
jgi:hypothetical protein